MAKENKSNIIIYQSEDGQTHIEVQMDEDTVWLSQQQMADLYQTSRTNVVEHIKHIYEDGELVEESTCIIRKSKFPPNPERSVLFSGKRTKRSVQKKGCTQHL